MKNEKNKNNGNGNGNGFVATIEPKNGNGNGTKKAEVKEQVNPVETMVEPDFDQPSSKETGMFKNMGIEIMRPDKDAANCPTSITVNMPIRIDTYAVGDNKRYAEIAIDTLRCHASSIFEHISKLGWVGENEDWSGGDFHGILDALGTFGKGIAEAIEVIDNRIKWGQTDDIPQTVASPQSENKSFEAIKVDYIHKDSLPELINAILRNEDMPTRFWNTIFDSLSDMNGEPLLLEPTVDEIWLAVNRENCRGLQIKRQTEETAQEISEPESLENNSAFCEARDEFLQTEAKAKKKIETAITSNNPETRRAAILQLLKLNDIEKISFDLSESLAKWLESEVADNPTLERALAVEDDCITETARDLEYLIRDDGTPPAFTRHIYQGLQETAKSCGFDLTGKTLDVDTLVNLISLYFVRKNEGELDIWEIAPEVEGSNFLQVSDKIFEALSKDAKRCFRTNENQLEAILKAYFFAEITPGEKESAAKSDNLAADRDAHYLQVTANKLSHIFNSEKVSDDIINSIGHIITNAGNEIGWDALGAEFVHINFPLFINSFSETYGAGILDSIKSILEVLPEEIQTELDELHIQYESSKSAPETVTA